MEPEMHFDLSSEPWLPVRFRDGRRSEVSLRDIFVLAHTIVGFDVDFPTLEPALLRLVLALAYRILRGPKDDAEWGRLWEADRFSEDAIDDYFARWRHRFDLFSKEFPFFQVADLEPAGKGGVKTANSLVAYAPSGNNVPVFTPITDRTELALSPAEAARWLVERHAFGSASDKTGAKGNPKVKGGKDTPAIGYLAWIGFVAPVGQTLRETLLLNLVPWQYRNLIRGGEDDVPAWERDPLGPTRVMRAPDGVCDLFTWQGRRIRLFPERRGDAIVVPRVLICAGDEVDRRAARDVDPHVGWRMESRRGAEVSYVPLRARPGQQVWRGLSSVLALGAEEQRAGVLSFVEGLQSRGIALVSLLVTSAKFGNMSTTLDDLAYDRLDTPLAVLNQEDPAAATVAIDAVTFAAHAAQALGYVAEARYLSYDLSFHEESKRHRVPEGKAALAKAARSALAEELYGRLDAPYRHFLTGLANIDDLERPRAEWAALVEAVARDLASRELAQLAPAQAFAGVAGEDRFRRMLARARNEFSPSDSPEKGAA
ncbi:CRISPR-associated protein, Cse1 family [Acidimicrobium ferrooxidans DSM 10331]|uniref:CRISPR-associated protein, Cse1 family n=2 Tax=Acidimicrobium ferrooxidans TaxID=53635 RepID=C7LYW9_ACIFD|nr:CRISPR-associated protein, Cse1 family [Acidimicrobium ferrooxidans DSM 10331]